MRHNYWRAVVVGTLVAGACGDDGSAEPNEGGSSEAVEEFCDDYGEFHRTPVYGAFLDPQAVAAGRDPGLPGFREVVEELKSIEPPDEIADDWEIVLEEFESPSVVDPQSPERQVLDRMETYLEEECGIDTPGD